MTKWTPRIGLMLGIIFITGWLISFKESTNQHMPLLVGAGIFYVVVWGLSEIVPICQNSKVNEK